MNNYSDDCIAKNPLLPLTDTIAPVTMNGHLAEIGHKPTEEQYENGIQIINGEKEFNAHLSDYLNVTKTAQSGFNYHLISVFGSQSTGKSTLLNYLFGTQFGVMSESERRQTTKGIWMSRNKQENTKEKGLQKMADGILVMDVEGTDGRERGEDQDFERKSALFALATSEVLIINIWEHQVGLYQGANMGLLKTVFEVNLQLFLKDKQSNPRSLLFFVIRDHLGTTPLINLRNTLIADLSNIWTSLSKPLGLEQSRIEDYFDFAFAALPHKILQPELFLTAVNRLGTRFRVGQRPPKDEFDVHFEDENGIFLPEYHRRIPADGFSVYAEGVWEQIISNKDLDLPSQQELLAQFRCDEISREVLEIFNSPILPLEDKQAEGIRLGKPSVLKELGDVAKAARVRTLEAFEEKASRYHKGVFTRKRYELETKIDNRLKTLYQGQLSAAHKYGISCFCDSVSTEMKTGQKKNVSYEFAEIVAEQKKIALEYFQLEIERLFIKDIAWTDFLQEYNLYNQELDVVSTTLRREEMRRLATRIERWVRTTLGELVGLEFNKLGSARRVNGVFEKPTVNQKEDFLWDRVWDLFVSTVTEAESRFLEKAKTFEADQDEIKTGQWRLRRKSWVILRAKLDEEVMEGNIMTKLRDNFEDRFRYEDDGVPRIWQPTDDIEGIYTTAKKSTICLIDILSQFILRETREFPALPEWIGSRNPSDTTEEEDLIPIRGVDDENGSKLEDEMTILSNVRRQDLLARFKKQADGVYIEAKRSAIGGVAQVPIYFWLLVLFLGWNEFIAVIRNPLYIMTLTLLGSGFYVLWFLNLWGPVISMAHAAIIQGINIGKAKLREFLEEHEDSRRTFASNGRETPYISLDTLDSVGKRKENNDERT